MDDDNLRTRVDTLFAEKFPAAATIADDAYFADSGALNSHEFVELVVLVEERFGIAVPDDDVSESTFGSKKLLRDYLLSRGV